MTDDRATAEVLTGGCWPHDCSTRCVNERVGRAMQGRRVLLIDDAEDIREVAQMSLELTGGWEVHTAGSGAEGLTVAKQVQPDVVILDVMMPEMDGPTTFGQLQADPATRDIPVIFLTAKVQESDKSRLLSIGARGVLAKPFDPLRLSDQVLALVG